MLSYQEENSDLALIPRTRFLQVGERVPAFPYVNNKKVWKTGTIVNKMGLLHYEVKLDRNFWRKQSI